jgi:excisionase family DNA binding protein
MDGHTEQSTEHAPDSRRPEAQHVIPGGRRELTLTLQEVATVLKCDVRTVKALIRKQALRAIRISPRLTRVTERALGEYLYPERALADKSER